MGGGKVTPNDEPPPPQSAAGEIKKHNLHSLKTGGDKQEAVHMQMVAGREHRQSDRSRNSSWMEISLQKERRGEHRGGQDTSDKENLF